MVDRFLGVLQLGNAGGVSSMGMIKMYFVIGSSLEHETHVEVHRSAQRGKGVREPRI